MTQAPDAGEALLAIGELAERTGVSAATLRVWEQRHGFPTAERLPSGHRRYRVDDVELVRRVVSLRDGGLRLDEAVARARASEDVPHVSVFAALREANPALPVHRLSKNTLIAMSWAIEDEFMARAVRPRLFGTFQHERFYRTAKPRWRDLARRATATTVMADFAESDPVPQHEGRLRHVGLAPDSPLHREWAVVCISDDLPVVLTAWELPGQEGVRDRLREYEAVWSLRPSDVGVAGRVCAAAAGEQAPPTPQRRTPSTGDAEAAAALFARAVAYLDRRSR